MTAAKQRQFFSEDQLVSTGEVELFPAVWRAAERMTGPDIAERAAALEQLVELRAPRLSPLIAYLVATLLTDSELTLRARVVEVLGDVLSPDEDGLPAPDGVRGHLFGYLSKMRTRTIYAILQVGAARPDLEAQVSRLLNACPYAGSQMAEILADRGSQLAVRQQAAHHIGQVGFLEARGVLERLETRLESRQAGQERMSFAPQIGGDEVELLPTIKTALSLLRAV